MIKRNFGLAIKKYRKNLGLSQEKFALSISMDRTYYASVESGKRNISLQNIAKIALLTDNAAIINPIEKGHPDIVPYKAINSSEEQLRNYPIGLEVKCTVGSVPKGTKIDKATPRIHHISNITWQAHHQEVTELFGVTFDYIQTPSGFKPVISATFYSNQLCISDWGQISGINGRNTKVCGMRASGKVKMGAGWFAILADTPIYWQKYSHLFRIPSP